MDKQEKENSPEVQNLVNILNLQAETIQAYKTINFLVKKIDEYEKRLEEMNKKIDLVLKLSNSK